MDFTVKHGMFVWLVCAAHTELRQMGFDQITFSLSIFSIPRRDAQPSSNADDITFLPSSLFIFLSPNTPLLC